MDYLIDIKVFHDSEIGDNKDILFDFFLSKYPSGYEKAVLNSNYIIAAIINGKVIGALRIITDEWRFALIVDFVVEEDMRGQGIGGRIIKTAIDACRDTGIVDANIRLFADPTPGKEWLVGFYERVGFIKHTATAMSYKG